MIVNEGDADEFIIMDRKTKKTHVFKAASALEAQDWIKEIKTVIGEMSTALPGMSSVVDKAKRVSMFGQMFQRKKIVQDVDVDEATGEGETKSEISEKSGVSELDVPSVGEKEKDSLANTEDQVKAADDVTKFGSFEVV